MLFLAGETEQLGKNSRSKLSAVPVSGTNLYGEGLN